MHLTLNPSYMQKHQIKYLLFLTYLCSQLLSCTPAIDPTDKICYLTKIDFFGENNFFVIEYDQKLYITKITLNNNKNGVVILNTYFLFEYDDSGKVLKSKFFIKGVGNQVVFDGSYSFIYNNAGDIVKVERFNKSNIKDLTYNIEYNDKHQVIKLFSSFSPNSYERFEYDDNNNLKKIFEKDANSTEYKFSEYSYQKNKSPFYAFDLMQKFIFWSANEFNIGIFPLISSNSVEKLDYFNPNGSSDGSYLIKYQFNKNGYPIRFVDPTDPSSLLSIEYTCP